ncbi:MAG: hypothetical protein HQK83_03890 [Fibrobacteria bacterium]|nr:hypothetical protein [Fibrobacteria bacterium]
MIKFFEKFTLAGVFLLALCFNACLDLGGEEDEAKITLDATMTGEITVDVGDTLKILGSVEANGKIDMNYKLMTGAGEEIVGDKKKIFQIDYSAESTPTLEDEKMLNLEEDAKLMIITFSSASQLTCGGDYILMLQAGVNGYDVGENASVNFTVNGPTCNDSGEIQADIEVSDVTIGAQGASEGSSLDADQPKAYIQSEAKDNSAKIDLFLAKISSGLKLFSPDSAAAYTFLIPVKDSWAKKNSTPFYKTAIGTGFDNIKSQYQIDAYWDETTTSLSNTILNSNDVFILKTDQGNIVLVKIKSVNGSDENATVVVSITKKKS